MVNPELIKLALYAVGRRQKTAFVPSDAVAGGGGGGDPSGGGDPGAGAPPGGGGPPPGGGGGDPSGGGAAGGGGMPGGVDLMSALPQMIQQQVQQALQQSGMVGQPGVAGTGGAGKPAKPDINTVAMDVFQLKKMFLHFLKMQGIDLPHDILDGPNRDPATGMPTAPGQGSSAVPAGGGGGPAPQSAIGPVQPMQGAFPTPPGGAGGQSKSGSVFTPKVGEETRGQAIVSKAAAVARMCRQRRQEPALAEAVA